MLLFGISSLALGLVPPLPSVDRTWPSSLNAHIVRGIRGAVAEAHELGGLKGGSIAAGRIARLCAQELLFFPLKMIPFAVRTMAYRSLNMQPYTIETSDGPQVLEVYKNTDSMDGPLILFVHGGSWGQGAPWQYALLARRLLEDGKASRVAVAKYRLFPEGDVSSMLVDVAGALEWCRSEQQKSAASGAQPLRVVLAAQSAGAHLSALHLSRRAWEASAGGAHTEPAHQWAPDKFVALSGVFDIAAHFSHERSRLVHWISPMWLAMIGRRRAASNAHDEVGHGEVGALNEPTPRKASDDESDGGFADDSGAEFAVRVVRAMGLRAKTEECAAAAAAAAADPAGTTPATLSSAGIDSATLAAASQLPSQGRDAVWSDVELAAWAAASPTRVLRLLGIAAAAGKGGDSAHAERLWPTTTVLHGSDDKTVPVQSARDFVHALAGVVEEEPDGGGGESSRARGRVRYVEYERAGHGEVMIALMSRTSGDELPQIARDFVREACSA